MRKKHSKGNNNKNTSNKKTNTMSQQGSHPTQKTNRSSGWFTEKDAKMIKKEVIGRFYSS